MMYVRTVSCLAVPIFQVTCKFTNTESNEVSNDIPQYQQTGKASFQLQLGQWLSILLNDQSCSAPFRPVSEDNDYVDSLSCASARNGFFLLYLTVPDVAMKTYVLHLYFISSTISLRYSVEETLLYMLRWFIDIIIWQMLQITDIRKKAYKHFVSVLSLQLSVLSMFFVL